MAQRAHLQPDPIPADLRAILLTKLSEQQLSAWATEAVVVEAAREHIISRRKAATLLGYRDYDSREAFFERHQLFNETTMEMLEQDFKTIDRRARRAGDVGRLGHDATRFDSRRHLLPLQGGPDGVGWRTPGLKPFAITFGPFGTSGGFLAVY